MKKTITTTTTTDTTMHMQATPIAAIVEKIVEKIDAAKELAVDEQAVFDSLTLQDWADALNAKVPCLSFADAAAKAATKAAKDGKAADLLKRDRDAMFAAFISDPFYTGKVIRADKKTGAYVVADVKRQLNFFDLERAFQLSKSKETDANGFAIPNKTATLGASKDWDILFNMFIDNLVKSMAADVTAKAPSLTDPTFAAKAEKDMEGYGLAKLEAQLRKVVAAILGDEISPKMLKQDVKFLREALTDVKFTDIRVKNEKAMMGALFMALKVRTTEDGNYSIISRMKMHKAKKEG